MMKKLNLFNGEKASFVTTRLPSGTSVSLQPLSTEWGQLQNTRAM